MNDIESIGNKYKLYRKFISQEDITDETLKQYWGDINTICKILGITISEMYSNKETFDKYMQKLSEIYKVDTFNSYSSNCKKFYKFWHALNNTNNDFTEKIKQYSLLKRYENIRDCEEYYCRKAIDKYYEFLNFKISEDAINNLINLIDKVPNKDNRPNNITWTDYYLNLISDENSKSFIEILLTLVSDIDMHASERNEYNGQRFVIGKTTKCYQNIWIKSLLNLYKSKKNMSAEKPRVDIKKCCIYLEDRINNFPIMNKEHLEKLSAFFPKLIELNMNCKNAENKTFLLKEILYKEDDIRQQWMNGDNDMTQLTQPLNQILYGPPGTGKTYNTVVKAMEIIKGEKLTDDKGNLLSGNDYKTLKEEFNKLLGSQIEFVTFHQSYSYEEFVEGIKPYIPEWGQDNDQDVKYIGKDGIFKKICNIASSYSYFENTAFEKAYDEFIEKNKDKDKILLKTPTGVDFAIRINKNLSSTIITGKNLDQETTGSITKEQIKYQTYTSIGRKGYMEGLTDYICNEYKLEKKKQKNNNLNYVLIIDEINRGNISKIFGELITLIEEDKREYVTGDKNKEYNTITVTLPYSGEPFSVPNNLYIIGTMNTADKSLALLDVALRRRFEFVPMYPQYKDKIKYANGNYSDILKSLNDEILIRKKNADYLIGHSYFLGDEPIENIFNKNVIPLLMEYFNGKVKDVCDLLTSVFDVKFDGTYLSPDKSKTGCEYYYLQVKEIKLKNNGK